MISKNKKNNILITCVGGPLKSKELLFLKKVSKYNNYIVGVDKNSNAIGRKYADRFYKVSSANKPNYLNTIINIIQKEKIELIIPSSDEEANLFSKNIKLFHKNGCELACSDYKVIKILENKIKTYEYLKNTNVPLPIYYKVHNIDNVLTKTRTLLNKNYDVVIKPAVSRGGRNVTIVTRNNNDSIKVDGSRQKLMDYEKFKKKYKKYKKLLPIIVMEKLYEPTYDLDILSHRGKVIRKVGRRRIIPQLPNEGHIIEKRKDLYKIASVISKIFNLNWLHDCDLMVDNKNNIKLLEINPRPSGSAIVSMVAGIPLLDDIIDIMRRKKIKKVPIPFNKKIYPYDINNILLKNK